MKIHILWILILCLACTPATKDSESEELTAGTFIGQVGTSPNSGLYEELNGLAHYRFQGDTLEIRLLSTLLSPEDSTWVIFKTIRSDVPGGGTYLFDDIDTTTAVTNTSFSGFYSSEALTPNEIYYSESGSLEVPSTNETQFLGSFDLRIFSKQYTGPDAYIRSYSSLKGAFYAVEE